MQIFRFHPPHVDKGVLVFVCFEKVLKEGTGWSQNYFVSFNLVSIFTGQGDISELLFKPQVFEAGQNVFLKIVPLQTKFFCAWQKKEERRVKLGHCASLLAPSSTTDWVSCTEEVANARAQYNLIQRLTQPVAPLYCHMMPFAEIGIILHCLSLIKQSR